MAPVQPIQRRSSVEPEDEGIEKLKSDQEAVAFIHDRNLPIEDQEDPIFYRMVDHFYEKGCNTIENHLATLLKGNMTEEQKRQKVKGILMHIKPVSCYFITNDKETESS